MHQFLIRFFVALLCCLPVYAGAATTQSIHVEWGYTPPSSPAVTGFKLYQEGALACQTQNPNAMAMDCQVSLIKDTTHFTLTATFSDGTESPHSAPFPFTVASSTSPPPDSTIPPPDATMPPATTGSKLFTFSWNTNTNPATLKGYRIYLNNALLCETTNSSATSLACKADLLNGIMTFAMTEVSTSGGESALSNLLVFDPTAYPELWTAKLVTFNWDYTNATSPVGFRLYQNNALVCQTSDPTARQLACIVDITSSTVSYGVTAVHADGTETGLSNLLTYNSTTSGSTPGDGTTLLAAISAAPLTGTAPLTVAFNASSSTGAISATHWDFGNGATATGTSTSHTYTLPGTYTAKLTVTDTTGKTSTATALVNVGSSTATATPPTAVVSSSTAAGPAPWAVQFNGSGSTAANGATITGYAWSFGDGTSATGASVGHTFNAAGTYTTTLTVTDSKGLTSSTSTPVVVSAPATANVAPKAAISATPVNGTSPLTVTFDGSASSDSDGTIAAYTWSFGDGSSATGKIVSHTYTATAGFTATLTVTDDKGATGKASTTITVLPAEEQTALVKLEMGEVAVTGNWVRVPLTTPFTNPVVIAGPAGFNNGEPGVIRLRNVDKTGFDIKFAEWDYLDKVHPPETVSYLVMEKGRFTLPNGSTVEAGSFAGTTSFKTVPFSKAFAKKPVVLTTVASNNEADTISGRVRNITTTGFAYYFREQEKNTNTHKNETVNYIAWEPGKGSIGTVQFEAVTTGNGVTSAWSSVTFPSVHQQPPLLLADMQTTNNTDTSALRVQKLTKTGFQVKVEEEQSKDQEVSHPAETVGYLTLNQPLEKVSATFTWTFDPAQEATISGFAILVNGEEVCATDSPSARTQSCEISMPSGPTDFTIQAKIKTGGTSSPSNSITYTP